MKVIILGSGTFVPELHRHSSGYLVEVNKRKIILDFGRGVIENLLKLRVNLFDLDKIFISHMHADHTSGLASFFHLVLNTVSEKKLREKYTIYGPKGIKKDIRKILEAFHIDSLKNIRRLEIVELSPNKMVQIGELEVSGFKAKHGTKHGKRLVNCFGYVLKNKNKKICYSGDSGLCEELKNACKNSDLAIIEANEPKEWWPKEWWHAKGHLSGEEAGKIASQANVKKLIITHVANGYLPDVEKDIRKTYKGNFSIAKDLMEIIV